MYMGVGACVRAGVRGNWETKVGRGKGAWEMEGRGKRGQAREAREEDRRGGREGKRSGGSRRLSGCEGEQKQ